MSKWGLRWNPERLHGVLNSSKCKTKCHLKGFHRLVGYYWNWIPNFSMFKPYVLLLCSDAQSWPTLCDSMNGTRQAPPPVGFSRQESWSGLPCPPPGDLPHRGIYPTSLISPELAGGFFTTSATWEALYVLLNNNKLDPVLWEEPDDIIFKALKESLKNPSVTGHSNDHIPFFLVEYEEGDALKHAPQITGIKINP